MGITKPPAAAGGGAWEFISSQDLLASRDWDFPSLPEGVYAVYVNLGVTNASYGARTISLTLNGVTGSAYYIYNQAGTLSGPATSMALSSASGGNYTGWLVFAQKSVDGTSGSNNGLNVVGSSCISHNSANTQFQQGHLSTTTVLEVLDRIRIQSDADMDGIVALYKLATS